MFTRSRETEDRKPGHDDLAIPPKPAPALQPPRAMPAPVRPPVIPSHMTNIPRASEPAPSSEPARRSSDLHEVRRLVVGREITLSGTITCCDQLVVEGSIEAHLTDCRDIDIAESGLFKGSATIEEAEIRGRFEGNLIVRKRLLIKSTGRVVGTIRYGQIEIECGGQIVGEIQAGDAELGADGRMPSAAE